MHQETERCLETMKHEPMMQSPLSFYNTNGFDQSILWRCCCHFNWMEAVESRNTFTFLDGFDRLGRHQTTATNCSRSDDDCWVIPSTLSRHIGYTKEAWLTVFWKSGVCKTQHNKSHSPFWMDWLLLVGTSQLLPTGLALLMTAGWFHWLCLAPMGILKRCVGHFSWLEAV
jgi:hypothetical protein